MLRNPLYTAKATRLISWAKELERFCQAIELAELTLTFVSSDEMRSHCQTIVHDADTLALPQRLIPAARALGDAAYLLEEALTGGVSNAEGTVVIDEEAYRRAHAYTLKALEALRSPARRYGADMDQLETVGGLYL
ncbi:MAG: hypothetical protein FWC48_00625 [Actinomycetia bacterium]|nr:hypothetical protein [Actinomycetes bacterium]